MKKESTANMEHYYEQTRSLIETLDKSAPEYTRSFREFAKQARKGGSLSVKTKELILIALCIAAHSIPCIAFHVKSVIEAGATREEILEAGMVAGLMGGAPAVEYLKYVVDACDQFGAD